MRLQDRDGKLVAYPQTQTEANNSAYIILNNSLPLRFEEIKEIANIQDTSQKEIILSDTLRAKMEPLRIVH